MPVFLPQIHALEKALPVHNKRDGVSGMGLPVVTRAARSRVIRDLPRSGSPSRRVILPRRTRCSQSQRSWYSWMSERQVPGSDAGADGSVALLVVRGVFL